MVLQLKIFSKEVETNLFILVNINNGLRLVNASNQIGNSLKM